jgi:hypothetical protein
MLDVELMDRVGDGGRPAVFKGKGYGATMQ